jgi:RimJ/RimL family protein N-acetyltransferase
MVTMPRLTTSRLILRPFTEADVGPLYLILRDREVLRYFAPTQPPTRDLAVKMIERISRHWEAHGYGLWAVESRGTGELMGRCGLQLIPETGEIEVDVILGVPYWGRGYATEGVEASLRYAAESLDVDGIVGIVHPENQASRRLLDKVGAKLTDPAARYFGMVCLRYFLERSELLRRYGAG